MTEVKGWQEKTNHKQHLLVTKGAGNKTGERIRTGYWMDNMQLQLNNFQ